MGQGLGTAPLTTSDSDGLVEVTRHHCLSRSAGQPILGIAPLCALAFVSAVDVVLRLLAMGPSATFDSHWNGRVHLVRGSVPTPLYRKSATRQ